MNGKRAPATPARADQTGSPTTQCLPGGEAEERTVTVEIEIPAGSAQRHRACVLIIAPHRPYADALSELLRAEGRQVETCYDGTSALHLADLLKPDIVLCDLDLRDVPSAYAVARALRLEPGLQHVRLVGLTGNDPTVCEEYAIRSGFNEVMRKSAEIAPLDQMITRSARRAF